MLNNLESGSKTLAAAFEGQPEHQTLDSVLSGYRDTVALLQSLGTWNDWNDDGMDALVEDMNESISSKLEAVATEILEHEQVRMKAELDQLKYTIDDSALLANITNIAGLRIEQVY
jgi:hypothetical protein